MREAARGSGTYSGVDMKLIGGAVSILHRAGPHRNLEVLRLLMVAVGIVDRLLGGVRVILQLVTML